MKKFLLSFAFLFLLFVALSPTKVLAETCPIPSQNPCWLTKEPMPTARREVGAAADASGNIYVVAGFDGASLNALEQYDPTTDTWTTKASAPISVNSPGFTYSPTTGTFYLAGGFNNGTTSDVYEYNPTTDQWTQKSSMQFDKFCNGLAAANGKIYSIGGHNSSGTSITDVEEYDPTTDTWITKTQMPSPRSCAGVVTAPNGIIYVIGGITSFEGGELASVDAYDPVANTWSTKASMSIARHDFGVSVNAQGKIYAIGGETPTIIDAVEEYDPVADTWTTRTSLPNPTRSLGAALGSDDKVHAIGGKNPDNEATDTNYAGFAPDSSQITALSPAKVWLSLKNPSDLTVKFDLKAEVYKDNTLVSTGQINSVNPGNGILGFINAKLETIPFAAFTPLDFPTGSALKLKVSVRNACSGSLRNSGVARLWYNDSQANSRFGATIGTGSNSYFLRDAFALATTAGPGPKKTLDVQAGARCSSFKAFGTWAY